MERDHPELASIIPDPDGISMSKLGEHGLIMSDACNAAQATRRALQVIIGGTTFVIDCFHHLRNAWCASPWRRSRTTCRKKFELLLEDGC